MTEQPPEHPARPPVEAGRPRLAWNGREERAPVPAAELRIAEIVCPAGSPEAGAVPSLNRLIGCEDNLHALSSLLAGNGETASLEGRVDLVYIDPPFALGTTFAANGSGEAEQAFRDCWKDGLDGYLSMLEERLLLLKRLLAPTGSLWLHCDWRAGHYVKVLLDESFGYESFRNEIVWSYGGGARGAKAVSGQFPRNHDILFWYGSGGRTRYRPQRTARRTPVQAASRGGYRRDAEGRWFKTAPRGDYTDASVEALDREGRIHRTASGGVRVKYFLRQEADQVVEDVLMGDVWTDIPDAMHLPAVERTGYPTQKPLRLLRRILAACSDPGDLALDCFCGSGTTPVAAETMQEDGQPAARRWIAVDNSRLAIRTTRERLVRCGARPFRLEREVPGA